MKRRLQRNIVLLFLGCAAGPLILVAAIGQWSASRSVISIVGRDTAFAVDAVDERFKRELRKLQDLLLLLAAGGVNLPPDWSSRARFTGSEVEYYTGDLLEPGDLDLKFTGFILLGPDGNPRSKVDYSLGMVMSAGTQLYYLQESDFSRDDSLVSRSDIDIDPGELKVLPPEPDSGTMLLQLATMVTIDGRSAGMLVGVVDAGELLDAILSEVRLGPDSYHFLVDSRSGIVLSHPDDTRRNQLLSVAMPEVYASGMLARTRNPDLESGLIRYNDASNTSRLLAHRWLANTPWVLCVVSPLEVFLSPISRVGINVSILVVLALAASTAGLFYATRHFRRSVIDLTEAAAAFSEGDLDHRATVRSDDEMGAVASAFNRMAEQIGRLIREREISARFESFNRLSAAVAHDLRGSLFSLSLLVENLERHSGNPQFLADAAGTLRQSLGRMKKTIGKITARESGTEDLLEAVELTSLLRHLVMTSGAAERPDLEKRLDLPDRIEVFARREELERLFSNLIHNALEAMTKGGTLTLQARSVGSRDGSQAALITVTDTGCGMDSKYLEEMLFEPFATTKERGIGLGLYTCRQIVERLGGGIEVESKEGEGTRVMVRIPVRP